MWLSKSARFIERFIHPASRWLNSVGSIVLAAMMFLVAADVTLRYVFGLPITGSYEIIELMMVVVVFLAVAYTATQKRHVFIELVISRFPPRVQAIIQSFTWLFSLALVILMSWWTVVRASQARLAGHVAVTWPIPLSPFMLLVAIGYALLAIVLLAEWLDALSRMVKK